MLRSYEGSHPDGYHLVHVEPPLDGGLYGYTGRNIDEVILAARHMGRSVIRHVRWPVSVHVALPRSDEVLNQDVIESNDLELIAWAEMYRSEKDVERG